MYSTIGLIKNNGLFYEQAAPDTGLILPEMVKNETCFVS